MKKTMEKLLKCVAAVSKKSSSVWVNFPCVFWDLNTWLEMLDISSAEDEEFTEPNVYSIESYAETEENIDTEKVFQDDVVIVDETVPSNYEEIIEEQINDVIENIKAEESIAGETETLSTFSTYADTNNSRKKIDLVYVIDTSGSMSSAISAAKSSMTTLVNNLYHNGIYANVAVVTYSDYICDKENGAIIHYANGSNWARNATEAQALINTVSLYGCGHETPLDGLEKAHRDLEFHEDATKFMVLITDEPYIYSDNRYGIATMQDLANDLKNDTIYTSVVCYDRDASGYAPLYNTTKGIQINLSSNWPVYLEEYIRTYIKELTSFKVFSPYNLTNITLDSAPKYGSNTDTDKDGFMDYEEIDWRFINKESDELILPTLNEYLIKTGQKNTFNILPIGPRYRDKINSILILPILTNPTNPDTDGDGVNDKEDTAPLANGLENGIVGRLNLISCHDGKSGWTEGHVFFVYTSYINDTINFSPLSYGWSRIDESKGWSKDNLQEDVPTQSKYSISVGESVSIGSGERDNRYEKINIGESLKNGVNYNMEVYKRFNYGSSHTYGINAYIYEDVTEGDLEELIGYCGRDNVSYWNPIHNCAQVACEAWNLISEVQVNPYNDDFFDSIATPRGLHKNLLEIDGSAENYPFTEQFQ